jgi:hypothetical protein
MSLSSRDASVLDFILTNPDATERVPQSTSHVSTVDAIASYADVDADALARARDAERRALTPRWRWASGAW